MEIHINHADRLRITTGFKSKNFVDITGEKEEAAIGISFLCSQTYFEVRKKDGQIKSFYFESKGHKKDFVFEWWDDAEVVFANDDVRHG